MNFSGFVNWFKENLGMGIAAAFVVAWLTGLILGPIFGLIAFFISPYFLYQIKTSKTQPPPKTDLALKQKIAVNVLEFSFKMLIYFVPLGLLLIWYLVVGREV